MKFGKSLLEKEPELHALYKQLKKSLRIFEGPEDAGSTVDPPGLPSSSDDEAEEGEEGGQGWGAAGPQQAGEQGDGSAAADGTERGAGPQQEGRFVALVEGCVQQLNEDYLSREEVLVIKADLAQAAAAAATSQAEVLGAYSAAVNLHGELVLLCHWSMMAYTGIVKILKKHYKRTGQRVQSALLGNLLGQPFCSLEEVRGLVRAAEQQIAALGGRLGMAPSPGPMAGVAAAAAVRDPAGEQPQQLEALRGSASLAGAGAAGGAPAPPAEQAQARQDSSPPQQPAGGREAGAASQQVGGGGADHVAVVAASGRALLKRDRSKVYPPVNKRHEAAAGHEASPAPSPAADQQSSGGSMQASQGGNSGRARAAADGTPTCGSPAGGSPTPDGGGDGGGAGPRRGTIIQRTRAALQLWKSLRSNAATPSTVLEQPGQQ